MSGWSVTSFSARASALAAALLLASCAVGPDFLHPAAPDAAGYTKEPLAPQTSSANAPHGQAQHFDVGRDISAEWWTLFRSPALNALIAQSIGNNPSLQTAIANLRAARQAAYAQEGKFFPLVTANFNPTESANGRRDHAGAQLIAKPLHAVHRADRRVVHLRYLGSQPADGRSAQGARGQSALPSRSGLSHADLKHRGRRHHRGGAARADRSHQRVDHRPEQDARHPSPPARFRLCQSQRRSAPGSGPGAGAGDAAAAAQGAGAAARSSRRTCRHLPEIKDRPSRSALSTCTCRPICPSAYLRS